MPTDENDRLLTRVEVEERFGISKRFLEISAYRGEGPPFVKIGRLVRYSAHDVVAWIEAKTVVPNKVEGR